MQGLRALLLFLQRPHDFRCPTFQEFSPAFFAFGSFGSTHRTETGATSSWNPDAVHVPTRHLNAKENACLNHLIRPQNSKLSQRIEEPKTDSFSRMGPGKWITFIYIFFFEIFFNLGS